MLTRTVLKKLWPKAPAEKINAIVKVAPACFAEWDITDPLVVAHLMAQISHENGAGTILRENMSYSAPRMLEIFGEGVHSAKVTPAEANRLAHKPKEIAERVYGIGNPKKAKEFNNTKPGDGWKYRGGGDLQLTGKNNYEKVGELTGFDLVRHPELLEDPATSFRVAVAEFVKLNCVKPAQDDNIKLVTLRVNGGYNGLSERTVWLRRWKAALAEIPTPKEPEDEPDEPTIPPPAEPRGGESDEPAPPSKSKSFWAMIVGWITGIGGSFWAWFSENGLYIAIIVVVILIFLLIVVGRHRLREIIEGWLR